MKQSELLCRCRETPISVVRLQMVSRELELPEDAVRVVLATSPEAGTRQTR